MKQLWTTIVIRSIKIGLLLSCLVSCSLTGATTPPKEVIVPSRAFLKTLLLQPDDYGLGWKQGSTFLDTELLHEATTGLFTEFNAPPPSTDVSVNHIYFFDSEEEAKQGFQDDLDEAQAFGNTINDQSRIQFTSSVAQQMRVYCTDVLDPKGKSRTIPHCVARAQYGSYIAVITAFIDQEHMTYDTFKHLVSIMDQRMSVVATK